MKSALMRRRREEGELHLEARRALSIIPPLDEERGCTLFDLGIQAPALVLELCRRASATRLTLSSFSVGRAACRAFAGLGIDVFVLVPQVVEKRPNQKEGLDLLRGVGAIVKHAPNHSKIAVVIGPDIGYFMRGSGNFGHNLSLECYDIDRNRPLAIQVESALRGT